MRPTRTSTLLWLTLLCGGCATFHSSRSAPGIIDVTTPPRAPASRDVELPVDPGEHVLMWNAGVLGGGGVSVAPQATGSNTHASASFSGETSLHLGWSDVSNTRDRSFGYTDPGTAVGINLGWTGGTSERVSTNAGYIEVEASNRLLYSIAGGWAYDAPRGRSGPQATLSVGPFYARTTTMLGSGTAIELGVVIKVPVIAYTWSR